MKPNNKWIMPICIGIMLVVSLVLYPTLPDEVPTKWGLNGEIVSTMPKMVAILFMPALAVLIYGITYIVPLIDPRRESYEKFAPSYERVRQSLVVFMLGLHVVMLTQYENPQATIKMVMFAASLLLVVLGNEMGRFRQTWFAGIRTPWTLADERVWKKTHRVGARWFVGIGLLNMIVALTLPMPMIIVVFLASVLGMSIGLIVYSYIVYKHIN